MNRSLGYYIAYAVLVVGTFAALVMSPRPISSTVVTLALFSFNLAAIIFLVPQVLQLIGQLRNSPTQISADDWAKLNSTVEKISQKLNTSSAQTPAPSAPALQPAAYAPTTPAAKLDAPSLPTAYQAPTAPANQAPATNASTTPAPAPAPAAANLLSGLLNEKVKVVPASTPSAPIHQSPAARQNSTQTPPAADATQGIEEDISAALEQTQSDNKEAESATLGTPPAQMGLFVETSHAVVPNAPARATPSTYNNPTEAADKSADDNATSATSNAPADAGQSPEILQTVRLIAKVAIPEDSVLCLRGEGAGLDWQEGVPLTYQDENVWSFESKTATPVTCQLYLNDEISAFGDDITLEPGQSLEVTPTFPSVDAQ